MKDFPKIAFVRVMAGTTAAIPEFDAVKNFRNMDIADFLNRINNTKEL